MRYTTKSEKRLTFDQSAVAYLSREFTNTHAKIHFDHRIESYFGLDVGQVYDL
jgi:hypothetical protein